MIQKFVTKLSEKEKKIFYVTIIFVSFALLDRLFLGPVLDRLSVIETEIEAQENSIQRDLRFLAYEGKITQESKAFSKYFTDTIQDDDVVNAAFLSTVEKLATQSNVNLIKSNPSESKKEKKYIKYYANLDCVGDLENVITFMHLINSTEDLLRVVTLNMTPKRGEGDEVNASMTVVKLVVNPDISAATNP